MKKKILRIGILVMILCAFSVVLWKNSKEFSGIVVTCGGEPYCFELQEENDKNYGFVVTDETELVWEDTSAFSVWEDVIIPYDDWDVFSTDMQVEVVAGEKVEGNEHYGMECIEEWYVAEKITVVKVGAGYFEVAAKPVIYLYPETETEVAVELDYDGILTCTYPQYTEAWNVTAFPDGTLLDAEGQSYNYLYWEGIDDVTYDFSQGFCVAGEDTAEFLEEALAALGLTRREANEFIVYWLPMMQENAYNIISFQGDDYAERAELNINPSPDTLIRVFMAWKPAKEKVDITPQKLQAPERNGFTVVEWGGTKVCRF